MVSWTLSRGGTVARSTLRAIAGPARTMAAAQAMEFHDGRAPGRGTGVAYRVIREKVPPLVDDRVMYPDIEAIRLMIEDNSILEAVEGEIGPLLLARGVTDLPAPNVAY